MLRSASGSRLKAKMSSAAAFQASRSQRSLRGQWMYPPHATILMVGLIRAGLVSLDQFAVTAFDLDDANAAVAHAARNSAPFG
jgi:hypothetical protein